MKHLVFKLVLLSFITFSVLSCKKDALEDVKVENPDEGGGEEEIVVPIDGYTLADVLPILGTYKGAMNAYEGGITTNQASNYYLNITSAQKGVLRVKGNGISYHEILLIEESGVVKPHPSMGYVKNFSWNSLTKAIDFTIEKPFVFVKYKGVFSF
jgi:hypothetical protein